LGIINGLKWVLVSWAIVTIIPPVDIEILNTAIITRLFHLGGPSVSLFGVEFGLYALVIQYLVAVAVLLIWWRRGFK
jgi:hypothetical protein